jgi:O-antigen/teichoic acid export membrane protein
MADQIMVSAANFLILVAVARLGGAAQTGLYVLSLRTVDFLTEIQNAFLWAPYTLFAPGLAGRRKQQYTGSVLAHQLLTSLAVAALLGAFGAAAAALRWQVAADVAFWSMLAAPGIHLREFARRISFANLNLLSAIAVDAVTFLLQATALATLWWAHQFTGRSALLVTGVSCLLAAGVYLLSNVKQFRFALEELRNDWKQNFSYGKLLLGSDLALLIGNQTYPWFLALISGPVAVAVFAACQALAGFARMFLIGAQNVLLPSSARAFADGSFGELQRLMRRGTAILSSGAALFSVGCLLAGHLLVSISYGKTFAQNGPLVFILSLSIFTTALTLTPTFALAAARRADVNMRINAATLAFHVIAGCLLVRLFGPMGAAYGLFAGGLLAAGMRWGACRRIFVPLAAEGQKD